MNDDVFNSVLEGAHRHFSRWSFYIFNRMGMENCHAFHLMIAVKTAFHKVDEATKLLWVPTSGNLVSFCFS